MRRVYIFLVGTALVSSGCSSLVARQGLDLGALRTREQVHEQFGQPTAAVTPTGMPCEEFLTTQMIAEPTRASCLAASFQSSLGVQELLFFPHEMYLVTRKSILGQKIRFFYDPGDKVTGIVLDGQVYPRASSSGKPAIRAANPQ